MLKYSAEFWCHLEYFTYSQCFVRKLHTWYVSFVGSQITKQKSEKSIECSYILLSSFRWKEICPTSGDTENKYIKQRRVGFTPIHKTWIFHSFLFYLFLSFLVSSQYKKKRTTTTNRVQGGSARLGLFCCCSCRNRFLDKKNQYWFMNFHWERVERGKASQM